MGWKDFRLNNKLSIRRLSNRIRRTAAQHLAKKRAYLPATKKLVSFSFDDFPATAVENGAKVRFASGDLGVVGRVPSGRIAVALGGKPIAETGLPWRWAERYNLMFDVAK